MATFTLVSEAVQGQVQRSVSIPNTARGRVHIDMLSTVFGTDATLSFKIVMEESFDGGTTFQPASGFPVTSVGGSAGGTLKDGSTNTGLLGVTYDFDGRARILRAIASPFVGGTLGSVVTDTSDPLLGLRPNSVPGSFDWGLTATII